jgi:tRNA (guanine-N(7)-)-methyltransferase subunit TRM82
VLIAGDLSGDAVAFPLTASEPTKDSRLPATSDGDNSEGDNSGEGEGVGDTDKSSRNRKLLLGHTASMLTGVRVVEIADYGTGERSQRILTSDRDEKVRVSAFPETYRILGYLLGHEAFVSCLSVLEGTTARCATCSGDGTVRLWDYVRCEELCRFALPVGDPPGLVPSRVAIHSSGTWIAVIYDESPRLDLIQVSDDCSEMAIAHTLHCASLALSVSWLSQPTDDPTSSSVLVVLFTQPPYVAAFRWDPSSSQLLPCPDPALFSVLNSAVGGVAPAMPTSVLEKDQFGEPMMKKNREKRGPAAEMPWNNAERKVLAKERERNYKKQKRSSKKRRRGGSSARSAA